MNKQLCILFFTFFLPLLLRSQDFRGGEFRVHTPHSTSNSLLFEVDIIMYYNTEEAPGPDSILVSHGGAFEPFKIGLAETTVLNRNIVAHRYPFSMQLLGPESGFIMVLDGIVFDAENVLTTEPLFLYTTFSNGLSSVFPFNPNIAHWNDFEFDYYIDENGDLRMWLDAEDEDGPVGYDSSAEISNFFHAGYYEYLDSLFFHNQTGEVIWYNPPGPGKYLMGFDLLDYRLNGAGVANYFNRLVVIELTEEDFLVNTTEEANSQNSLHIFPNPAANTITIELPSDYDYKRTKQSLSIFNAIGQHINCQTRYNSSNAQIEIDLSPLPCGIYTYKLDHYIGQFIKISN